MHDPIEPELRLALAYAAAPARAGIAALWRLDARLGEVLAASEPGIRLIRLAWWREALAALDRRPPPAEPLLQEIAAVILPLGVSGMQLSLLEDGWVALAEGAPFAAATLVEHAQVRGRTMFALAGQMLGGAGEVPLAAAGESWGLADVLVRLADPAMAAALRRQAGERLGAVAGVRWPRRLRPLGVLSALAARDLRIAPPESRGAPRRVLRALRMGMTGR